MKKTKTKKGESGNAPSPISQKILAFLQKHAGKRFSAKQLQKELRGKLTEESIYSALKKLHTKQAIKEVEGSKFIWTPSIAKQSKIGTPMVDGYVDMTRTGSAFIISDKAKKDVFVSPKNLMGAMNGDLVRVAILDSRRGRPEGVVAEVLERTTDQFIGIYRELKNESFVLVESPQGVLEIEIPKAYSNGAQDYNKVIVQITQWKIKPRDKIVGKVSKVIEKENPKDVEMQSILISHGFPLEFSETVLQELHEISDRIPLEAIVDREDFRDVLTFTIDPVDAKDFDDAISFRVLPNKHVEIGVHIADVGNYVKEKSHLDIEASLRGNSVYLVDRVLPMLPERLSNHLCSLRPNEDKLTFSVIFEFDNDCNLVSSRIRKTIIHSNRRFTYEEAQQIIEDKAGPYVAELLTVDHIAKHFRSERLKNGAIDFESSEVRFALDNEGNPESVYVKVSKDAHQLIEEFMLLANKTVAGFISEKSKKKVIPFAYRIHDMPDPEKLAEFAALALGFGVKLNFSTPKMISKSMNYLTAQARIDEKIKVLTPLAIRTMAKAEYNPENIGHYGLGFRDYGHFTSPIRRYADLMVHRTVYENLTKDYYPDMDQTKQLCRHISNQERKAMESERESTKYFQVLYMMQKVGQEFYAQVTNNSDYGYFILIDDIYCDGLIRTEEAGRSRKSFSKSNNTIELQVGQKIKVRLDDADLMSKKLEFSLVE